MSKLGKVLLISSSVIVATALLAVGCKKLIDNMEIPSFEDDIYMI